MPGSRLLALAFLALVGCDTPDRVDALERTVETLQQQEQASAKSLEALQADLDAVEVEAAKAKAAASAAAESATTRISDLESTVALLEDEIEELDKKVPVDPPPKLAAGKPDPAARYLVPVGDSATKGPADAKITIVMISDFQCPFCKRVQSTLDDIEREYGDDVRFVAKHNPLSFHARARPAAIAAEAAGKQGKFWEMHDMLYENNRALSDADLARYAKKAGCNASSFKSALSDRTITRAIDDDVALATKLGARGTPSFFVNGRYLAGAQPFSAFKSLIDEELAHADRTIAGGTSAAGLYEELMRTARPTR
ncbi:MAG: thioredoxin domain-containing protein [Myxococcota bacterium]